jgi:hypothetical protein
MSNTNLKKHYITDKSVSDTLIEQGASLQMDEGGYFVVGWTQGVAAIDLHNQDNCATYLCWMENYISKGIKVYFNQFKCVE